LIKQQRESDVSKRKACMSETKGGWRVRLEEMFN